MNAAERAQVLAASGVFASIPGSELAMLSEMMRTESFPAGSTVMETGEEATYVYVLASGSLAVYVGSSTEPTRTLDPGAVLGEFGMFGAGVRTATVKAVSDAVLLSLDYERFREYLLRYPRALWVLLEGAVKKLHQAESRPSRAT